jgi:hypothetical protein
MDGRRTILCRCLLASLVIGHTGCQRECPGAGGYVAIELDPWIRESTVEVRGACGAAKCISANVSGCTSWESLYLGEVGDMCEVIVTRPSGEPEHRTFEIKEHPHCDDFQVENMHFE